ncbi:MAG: pilus assembly protein PilM [Bdellovibrionales bacterium]|nr:pilus assembly protein PilM [Bdellovibrionales bacterium]
MFSIGIDIGSYSIKVAKVRSSGKSYELVHYSEYPLSQDPNKDNQIETIEILRDVHSKIWEEGTQYVVGAHQFEVSIRRREFPFRERHKILKSLPFELEDDIPFSAENSIFDAKITHYTGNTAHLLACACPKEHLVQILKRVGDGGIQPDIVSVDGLALANLFEEWREAPWEYAESTQPLPEASTSDVIISIGHKTSTALVIKDGYLLDLRLVDFGGKDIAEAISARYSMHYLEALKELRKKAFILTNNDGATREQIALSEVIKASIDPLAQKLRLALLDMQSRYNIEYRQAILIGGVSQLRNLGPYLTQKLELSTNRLGKLDFVPQLDFASSPNSEVSFVTAIGLAIEGVKRAKNPSINLLKGEYAKQNQSLRFFWDKWGYATKMIAASFVLLTIWGSLRVDFSQSNAEVAYDLLRTQAKTILGSKRPNDREINGFIREQEQKLQMKEMIESLQGINSTLDILKQISALAPNSKKPTGLNVRVFNVNSDTVNIVGEASRVEIINKIQDAIKSVAVKGQIQTMPPTIKTTPGYKSFSYTFKVNRNSGGK